MPLGNLIQYRVLSRPLVTHIHFASTPGSRPTHQSNVAQLLTTLTMTCNGGQAYPIHPFYINMSEDDDHDGDPLSDELLLFCQSDSISLEGLHEILQRYGMTANDSRHISDYTFFLHACYNEHVDEAIIKCLIDIFPAAVSVIDEDGQFPLHLACMNDNATPGIIRLLVTADPSSRQVADEEGNTPLHHLCVARSRNDPVNIEILKILLTNCSSTSKHANNTGVLPIHYASMAQSPEFCSILIDAYPGSERMQDDVDGRAPFHTAIRFNDIAAVEYFYKLYPEAENCIVLNSSIPPIPIPPIYSAIKRLVDENYCVRRGTIDIVRFLLKCDPNIKFHDELVNLLSYTCDTASDDYNDCDIDEVIQVVEAIYDAYPELINDDELDIDDFHPRIQTFLNGGFVYASQAKDQRMMTIPDENGQLPLHQALENNVRLGSIKLLVDGNPSAMREGDHNFAIPLHLACEHSYYPEVIEYLVGLDPSLVRYEDADGNTALHYACRGAKYATIALLLDGFDAVSVSKKNRHSELPIDLFMESDAVEDKESVEYTDIIFRLLRAYPGAMIERVMVVRQSVSAPSSSTGHVGKKRKVGDW